MITRVVLLICCLSFSAGKNVIPADIHMEFGYVNINPGAEMFYWVYLAKNATFKPLVLWLQGGPGDSSTGIGNFFEIGPYDINMEKRDHSWIDEASLLFVDSPLGSGFSYAINRTYLPTNDLKAANDLLVFLRGVFLKIPLLVNLPLYIVGEGYGAKMAAELAYAINRERLKKTFYCKLLGVGLGNPWISPADSVAAYAPFLHANSLIENSTVPGITIEAISIARAIADGAMWEALASFRVVMDTLIRVFAGSINMFNIFSDSPDSFGLNNRSDLRPKTEDNHYEIFGEGQYSDLSKFMNGPVKSQLKIPRYVVWGGQRQMVRDSMEKDFMKPSVKTVEFLLNNTDIQVLVYNGQLNLLVPSMGTEAWVHQLKWPGLKEWKKASRVKYSSDKNYPLGFYKRHDNFQFHWILRAGQMVPFDAGLAATKMLRLKPGPHDATNTLQH